MLHLTWASREVHRFSPHRDSPSGRGQRSGSARRAIPVGFARSTMFKLAARTRQYPFRLGDLL
jgi:hypothetical protein